MVADAHDEFAAWLRRPVSDPAPEPGEDDVADESSPPPADDAPGDEPTGERRDDDDIDPERPEVSALADDAIAAPATDEDDQSAPATDDPVEADAAADEPVADGGWAVDDEDDGWIAADIVGDAPALLPALAGRLETIHGALATLAMRIDAVAAAMGTFRSTFGDRVDDYTETVAQLQRATAADLDEQRRSTERLVAELRRGVSGNDTALRRLTGQVDDVVAGIGDLARRAEAEPEVEPAGPTLDEVGAAVAEHAAVVLRTSFETLRAELDEVREAVGALGPLGAAVLELGHGFDLLRDELARSVRLELDALGERLDAGLGAARDEIHLLKRRLAVRAKAPASLDGDQLDAIADAVMGRMAPAAPAPDIDIEIDIDTMAEAVAARVVEHLERRSGPAPEALAKEEPAPEAQVEEGPAPGALAEEGPAPGVQATKKKPVPRVQATKKKPVPRAQAKKKPAPGAQAKKEPAPERAVRRRT
ncbi:MAG: hypothetical protein H0V33_07330 [Acidimicrobiia bacterium]|nr:hypothetical protein [Acidimicrobiia bacterium]